MLFTLTLEFAKGNRMPKEYIPNKGPPINSKTLNVA